MTGHDERVARELIDLAQQHMHRHDLEVGRWWSPRARRRARWRLQAATYVVSVAQAHASLAAAQRER